MREAGTQGSIVTLLCDRGERYADTLYDADWRAARGLDVAPWQQALTDALATGTLTVPDAVAN